MSSIHVPWPARDFRALPRIIIRACAAVAIVLLSACQRPEEAPAPEIRPVRVVAIEKRATSSTISLTGNVQAETEVNLSFRIDGRMIERAVGIGDTVRPGQLVARLDPENEQSALQAARAAYAAANAQLVEARNNFVRMRDLVAENAVSRAAFDQAEALLKSAQAQLESAQSQVDIAQNRMSYTRLVSTVAGVVTVQGAEPGEVVGAGRMIVQVAREGTRDAVFDIPARAKEHTPLGAEIGVVLTADPKVTATGRVREISPRADPVTGTFRVRVRLIKPPAAMRLGTTVTGRIRLPATASIEIPASAVIRADRQAAVWVVDPKTGTVATRDIQVAASDPERVQVASGLNAGDVVVTAGVQALRPGQKVRPLETRN
ncbi:MAG: efflux RND transporter periplasmic adaptor subunit [Burkholderiales bacterium]|nr:efflux RND transporter periplasmic adaptor subunit [Burkholderiales bacterium]